jgi:hypothetical protein
MNILGKVTVGLLLWGFFFSFASARDNHVVLVSVDGLAAYHLEDGALELPSIRALIRGGVWAASAETVFPSVTHPSHTTTPLTPRMFPGLVLSGHGIREGIRIGHVRNHDIAPAIAELLNLDLPEVEGRVLQEALKP